MVKLNLSEESTGHLVDMYEARVEALQKNINKLKDIHCNIRNVLIKYKSKEYGDCIIDEISECVGIPPTTVYYDEE
jgi:hypothetical protein